MSFFYADGDYYSLERTAAEALPSGDAHAIIGSSDQQTFQGMSHFLSDRWVVVPLDEHKGAGPQLAEALAHYGLACALSVSITSGDWTLVPFGDCSPNGPAIGEATVVSHYAPNVQWTRTGFRVDDRDADWREARRLMLGESPAAHQALRRSRIPSGVGMGAAIFGSVALLAAFADVVIVGPLATDLGVRNEVAREATVFTLVGLTGVGLGATITWRVGNPKRSAWLAFVGETAPTSAAAGAEAPN